MQKKLILAIDTSCDDTSAAVTVGNIVLSNVIASQTELHKPYGGVFPTVAKQAHKENIERVVEVALQRAGTMDKKITMVDIAAIAVTQGPGLAPALEVGIAYAQRLAVENTLPLIPINHLEGHLLSPLAVSRSRKYSINEQFQQEQKWLEILQFPILGIIISGGHSQFVRINALADYEILGQKLDDAAGECLDKVGRMLHLGYPAGALIEKFAKQGNPKAYDFPLPLTHRKNPDLSFSGLKTYSRNLLEELTAQEPLSRQQIYDFAASLQNSVFTHICYKLNTILEIENYREIWLGGGVAANIELRRMIRETIRLHYKKHQTRNEMTESDKNNQPISSLKTPYSKKLCMDNAAMIGVAAGLTTISFNTSHSEKNNPIERMPRMNLAKQSGTIMR